MRVFICGIEGYIGFALANHLLARGDTVGGLDTGFRDQWVREVGSESAIPVQTWQIRSAALQETHGERVAFWPIDMRNQTELKNALQTFQPDVVVHLAEQPSAPFSQIDGAHARLTQECNIIGSLNLLWAIRDVCPTAHLLKLGTMGEYGTPPIDRQPIPEAGPQEYPRQPGSLYHASKVADSVNTEFACRIWGTKATDVMQGVVYGTRVDAMGEDPRLATRFDFDAVFGTAINRFCAQVIAEVPITPYGAGNQRRGFLPLRDSVQCLTLLMDNPPKPGEYRVVNQLDEVYSINDLAQIVAAVAKERGGKATIRNIGNPRIEQEDHPYSVTREILAELGYQPAGSIKEEIGTMLNDLMQHSERIVEHVDAITPTVQWGR